MPTNFPTGLDTFVNPDSKSPLSYPSHSDQHKDANDAIEAIQTVIGIENSNDTGSLVYKVNTLSETVAGIGNSSDTITELLGLEGNNDLTVNGIENKTTVDSFSKTAYRSANYSIQISRGNEYEAFEKKVLQDGTDILVTTSNVIANTDNALAVVAFEENSGMINLCVTPVTTEVSVRFVRTALKN
jgi:hypothetical protein